MTAAELVAALKAEGWREDGSSTGERTHLWRPSDLELQRRYWCITNGRKVYPHIVIYNLDVRDLAYVSVEIEITAHLLQGVWHQTKLYSMTPAEFYADRDGFVERTLTMWKATCDALRTVDFDIPDP